MNPRRGLVAVAAGLAVVLASALVSWGVASSVLAQRTPSDDATATSAPLTDTSLTAAQPRYAYTSPSGIAQGSVLGYAFGQLDGVPAGPTFVGFTITVTLQVAATLRCYLYDVGSGTELAASAFQLAPVFTTTTFSAMKLVTLPPGNTMALRCEPGAGVFTAVYADQSIVAVTFSN